MSSTNATDWIPVLHDLGALANMPSSTNVASQTNYRFVCERIPKITYFCTSVNTPTLSASVTTLNYMFAANDIKFPGGNSESELSIRFIVNEDFSNYREMVNWQRATMPYRDFTEILPDRNIRPSYGRLFFLNNKRNPVMMMTFGNLVPTQISGFTLSHSESDPTPISATVNFHYDEYHIYEVS